MRKKSFETIMINVSAELLHSAAFNARIRYWGRLETDRAGFLIYETEYLGDPPHHITPHKVNIDDLARGAALLAQNHSVHFGYLLSGRADGGTGDLLLQYTIFCDLKYG